MRAGEFFFSFLYFSFACPSLAAVNFFESNKTINKLNKTSIYRLGDVLAHSWIHFNCNKVKIKIITEISIYKLLIYDALRAHSSI